MTEAERLAERCRDAWAVLRTVPLIQMQSGLERHGRYASEDPDDDTGIGVGDESLVDAMLEIAAYLDGLAR